MRWRNVLHVVTAFAVVAGIGVTIVTGREEPGGAVPVSTSVPLQWASPAIPVTATPSSAPDPTTTTAAPTTTEPPTTTTLPAPITAAPTTSVAPLPAPQRVDRAPQVVATIVPRIVQIYDEAGSEQPVEALYSTTYFGSPTTLPVVQRGGDWLKVMLPTRPNGSEGWIHAADAKLSTVVDYVRVDLGERRLVWVHDGVVALDTTVAVGAPSSPTPTGSFFVTDLLPQDPRGPYGAWIVGLDAHSEVMSTFEGGDARIGIHGTNDPASIGQATSSGCVRVDATSLDRLARSLPLGTPVDIIQ
jgi:L,D-transpeptidase catalytic domain